MDFREFPFQRQSLEIPDKPHSELSRVFRTESETPFSRLARRQTWSLKSALATFQTVSRSWTLAICERKG
jgi:hypothetical protein